MDTQWYRNNSMVLSVVFLFLFLGMGCEGDPHPPLHQTFWDAGTEIKSSDYWILDDPYQYHMATINGALPDTWIGAITKKPMYKAPYGELSLREGKSIEVITEIKPKKGTSTERLKNLVKAKSKILKLQQLGNTMMGIQLKIASLKATINKNQEDVKKTSDQLISKMETLSSDDYVKIIKALSHTNALALSSGDKKSTPPPVDKKPASSPDNKPKPPSKTLPELLATQYEDLKVAKENFDAQYKIVDKLLNQSGMYLIRWNTNSSSNANISTSNAKAGLEVQSEGEGFMLVSSLRIRTLVIGTDFPGVVDKLKIRNIDDKYLTTHIVEVGERVSLNELSVSIKVYAQAKIKLSEMTKANLISQLDAIELDYAFARLINLSNTSVVGEVERVYKKVDWDKILGIKETEQTDVKYQPLSTLLTANTDVRNRSGDDNDDSKGNDTGKDIATEDWAYLFTTKTQIRDLLKLFN